MCACVCALRLFWFVLICAQPLREAQAIEAELLAPGLLQKAHMYRVGQNRIYTPYMTVYLVISLPKYCIYTVYKWFWPTLHMNVSVSDVKMAELVCGSRQHDVCPMCKVSQNFKHTPHTVYDCIFVGLARTV